MNADPTLDLRYHHPALRWERVGIVIWWVLFLIAAGWTWMLWAHLHSVYQYDVGVRGEGVAWAHQLSSDMIGGDLFILSLGVLPFVGWTIFRWIITGRWFLRP